MFREIELDESGREYVREVLLQGNTLAQKLRLRINESTRVVAYLPHESSDESAFQFHVGGVSHLKDSNCHLSKVISHFLELGRWRSIVLEAINSHPEDPLLESNGMSYIVHGLEVYFFLMGPNHPLDEMVRYIREAKAFVFIGALIENASAPSNCGHKENVDLDMLDTLAYEARHVIVDAYDGEAYLLATFS